jgi:biopolymer transport protein ExbD
MIVFIPLVLYNKDSKNNAPLNMTAVTFIHDIVMEITYQSVLMAKQLMTEMNTSFNDRRRPGIGRQKNSLRIDMTPMVDLGFILITFFVMTVQLTLPAALNLNMPKEGGVPITLGESDALTVLLEDGDRVYYYHGKWEEAIAKKQIYTTDFSVKNGLGKVIREKQKWLDEHGNKEGRRGLMLLIKPGYGASYQNVIDALDEATINGVKKYAIVSVDGEEKEWMKTAG